MTTVSREGDRIVLPGLATAHSHAFQRALRGRTQRREGERGSFWSWRGLMYQFAERLDPESIYALSRHAYAELLAAGVTAVGEFHYVHHQPDGTPYGDRIALADAVVRAARDTGIRIALLRVLYHRAGHGRPAEGAQRRFSDPDVDVALADVDELATRFAGDPGVTVGVAPHSVRAVPRAWLAEAASFARGRGLPLHMHVAEQRRELEECIGEHGMPPVRMLAEDGILGDRFVAVHATHLEPDEAASLGRANALVCICRTTERDLGDGLCNAAELVAAGARLCTGVDSHAVSDPFEEARAIELDDRSRAEARHVAAEAPALLEAASANGYDAIGMPGAQTQDRVVLDAGDPALAGAPEGDELVDAVIFSARAASVREVWVDGRKLVEAGRHVDAGPIRRAYEAALRSLLAVMVVVALAGCGDDGASDADAGPDAWQELRTCNETEAEELWEITCTFGACHGGSNPAAGIDLEQPGSLARMANADSTLCGGQVLVVPGSPEESYLIEKLLPLPSCGQQMPSPMQPMSAEKLSCVRTAIRDMQ